MKVMGIIPARFDSSRFPGKPLANICGHPMIWWVYHQCVKVKEFCFVCVATDDERIQSCCETNHIPVVMTSKDHKTGTDRVGEVAMVKKADLYVNVQGDEPVINPEMIRETIRIFDDESVYFGSLRKEITDYDEINAYSTVKVVVNKNEDALYFSRSVIPSNKKEDVKTKVYRHVGIYAYKRDFLLDFIQMPQSKLELGEGIEPLRAIENGYKIRVKETEYSSIGVDYPEHIAQVEEYIKANHLDKAVVE